MGALWHQHGVSIQISINLGNTFLRIYSIRNTAVAWTLARVFEYLPSFFSQILDLIYWTVLIFYFDLLWMAWHWNPAIVPAWIMNIYVSLSRPLTAVKYSTLNFYYVRLREADYFCCRCCCFCRLRFITDNRGFASKPVKRRSILLPCCCSRIYCKFSS